MTDDQDRYTPGSALPLGLPTAHEPDSPSAQVNASLRSLRGTNTPRTASAERHRRVRAAALAQIDATLPDRDRLVLRTVGAHRYLTVRQIQQFVFLDHTSEESAARTARLVTKRLGDLGLLRPLERRVGGLRPGSDLSIWQLTPAGAKLLRADRTNYRTYSPSPRFLQHCLAVADVHLALRDVETDAGIEHVETQTEPDCWRRYVGPGGEQRWLQPDLWAHVQSVTYDDRWFIEVDLGTESLPTLLGKCRQYEDYRASGIEQDQHGTFPLVLWVFTKPQRIEQLRAAVYRSRVLPTGLFRFVGPADVQRVVGGRA